MEEPSDLFSLIEGLTPDFWQSSCGTLDPLAILPDPLPPPQEQKQSQIQTEPQPQLFLPQPQPQLFLPQPQPQSQIQTETQPQPQLFLPQPQPQQNLAPSTSTSAARAILAPLNRIPKPVSIY
jgi:hypothetical protein